MFSSATRVALTVLVALVSSWPLGDASGVTIRYGLVLGNNVAPSSELPALTHAEREAERLGTALERWGGFERSRLIVLTRPTRAEMMAAAEKLIAQKRADAERYPNATSIFGFFFTGHGLDGRILLADGPVDRQELGQVFRRVGASFALGFFDACYSGSLTRQVGKGGIKPRPVGDLFETLPPDVLSAEGTMWFTSSGEDELSFEDESVGGVFTHFFIQAMTRAHRDGPAISLDRLWRYARDRTVQYTTTRRQPQKPRMLARLRGEVFPYFSFPLARTSTLTLGPRVEGTFELSWAAGSLSQLIEKRPGAAQTIRVFPGEARLARLIDGRPTTARALRFGAHPVAIRGDEVDRDAAPPGFAVRPLWRKSGVDGALVATLTAPATTVALGARYAVAPGLVDSLSGEHVPSLVARIDRSRLAVTASLGYGYSARDFDAWAYESHSLQPTVSLGYAFDLGRSRLSVGGEVGGAVSWQRFDDGTRRTGWGLRPGATVDWMWPANARIRGLVGVHGGPSLGLGIQEGGEARVGGWFAASVGVLFGVGG